jgi:hypothetical protein
MMRNAIVGALLVLVAGCGASAKGLEGGINRNPLSGDLAAQHTKLVGEGDAAWEARADRAQLQTAIDRWEAAIKIKDDDHETYAKLARACYLMADGWLFLDKKEPEMLAMYERGYRHAERGMAALSPDFEKRRRMGTKIEDAVKVLGRNGVPMLYWYGTNLGKWAKAKGILTILEYKDVAYAMISRVYELAPDYFYGAADRYFGAYYAALPKSNGGDIVKSYEHFQASMKAAPNYLGTYLLIAELYAPVEDDASGKAADENTFNANLQVVLNAQPCPETGTSPAPCIMKGLEPEAALDKRKAEDLMARKGEFF